MAEEDKRVQVLEDEIKVLKGEIRRTLVDLRAYLMREGSPLSEGAFGRRSAPNRPESLDEPPAARHGVVETVVADPENSFQTGQAEMGSPGVIAGNFVVGVKEAEVAARPETAAAAAAPGAAGAPIVRPQVPPTAGVAPQDMGQSPFQEVEVEEEYILDSGSPDRIGVHIHQAAPPQGQPESRPQGRTRRGDEPDPPEPRAGRRHEEDWDDDLPARSRLGRRKEEQPGRGAGSRHRNDGSNGNGRGRSNYEENEEAEYAPRQPGAGSRNGRGSRVYDEYLDLLAETEELYPDESNGSGQPLDVNLLASLVRWASVARQRVGEQRVSDILELYYLSGHSYPGLQELLKRVASIVDDVPSGVGDSAEECIDLLSHLHGILTGAQPIFRSPQMRLSDQDRQLLARSILAAEDND